MKTKRKIAACSIAVLVCMLLLPIIAIRLIPGDSGMGASFLLFFLIDPLLVLALGITAGTDIKRLWWIPVAASLFFPFGFSIAILEMVWDLFFYTVIYLTVSVLAMLGTHVGIRSVQKRKQ